jgi:hypothetical protein
MLGLAMDPEKKLSKELVTIFETSEDAEALVVHGLLESAGIEALMTSLYAQQEILPGVGGVVLRVAPEDAEEARRVIEEYSASPDPGSEANGEPEAGP